MNMEAGEKETSYIPIRVLGRGAFGEAVLYRKVADNSLVVWKEVILNKMSQKEQKDSQNEIDILSMLNHSNITSYYNHFLDGETLLIEMEYANGGNLNDKLAVMNDLLPEKDVLWYTYQLVSAVAHIHEYGILHRDIKTLNIFLTKSNLLKLGDFGISRIMNSKSHMAQSYVGTVFYMSPELIKGEPYNYKSDIWAVGCVLYELLTLTRVFDATNPLRLASEIVRGNFSDISPKYSHGLRGLCHQLLHKDYKERPEAEEILKNQVLDTFANEFDGQIWELNSAARKAKMSLSAIQSDTIMPVVTSQASEVYFWGGGKQTPLKQEIFTRGHSAIDISVGKSHMAVVTVEKELYTWASSQGFGTEMVGQLGHGDVAAYKAPKKVEAFESIPIKQVSCGEDFTICVTDEGAVYAFGSDYYGCLGCGNQEGDEVCTPVLIEFFNNKPVEQVSCGDNHVIALSKSGEVYTWGCGEFGRLGLGSEDDFSTPQKVQTRGKQAIKSVHAGSDTTFVVKTNGRVLACGSNEFNKLGFNSAAQGLCKRKEQISYDIQCRYTLSTVKPLMKYNIQCVSPGQNHTAALDLYGHVITFGSNKHGQLGVGDYKERTGVNRVGGVLAGKQVTKVDCGDEFTVLATADNQVYSWGLSENGRLGTISTDQGKGPGGQCFALPKTIFGSLHRVSAISCHHWHTGMVAEKIFSQKTIRSVSSSSRLCSYESQESLIGSYNGSEAESSVHKSTLSDRITAQHSIIEENSEVPDWLLDELDNQFIAMEQPPENKVDSHNEEEVPPEQQVPPPGLVTEDSVPPWLRKELDEGEFIPASPGRCDIKEPQFHSNSQNSNHGNNSVHTNDIQIHNASQSSTYDDHYHNSDTVEADWRTETARMNARLSQLEFELASVKEENQALKKTNKQVSDAMTKLESDNNKLQAVIAQQAETIKRQAQTIVNLEDKMIEQNDIQDEVWTAIDCWTADYQDIMKSPLQVSKSIPEFPVDATDINGGSTTKTVSNTKERPNKINSAEKSNHKLDFLFEPYQPVFEKTKHSNRLESIARGRQNSADSALGKTTKTGGFKRTQSFPEQMNIQLELYDEQQQQMCDLGLSNGSSKWKSVRQNMLAKSYTSSKISQKFKGVTTTVEQII